MRGEGTVPVDDAHAVHVVEGRRNFGYIMHCPFATETALVLQMIEKLATRTVVQHKVKFIFGLRKAKIDSERGCWVRRNMDEILLWVHNQ